MKRKIFVLLLSALILLTTFTSCGNSEKDDEGGKQDKPISSADISAAGKTAKISFQIEDNEGHNRVQIPKFSSDEQSAAIDQINADIENIITFYKEADNNKLKWPLIYTEVYESDRYLQAVVEYQAYPDIEGSSVATFVYDKVDDKAVTVDDAFVLESTSETQIKKVVEKSRCAAGESLSNFVVQGVYIDKKGNCQFFIKYDFDAGFDVASELATYIPSSGKLLGAASETSVGLSVKIDD